jgi:hypothetical protein
MELQIVDYQEKYKQQVLKLLDKVMRAKYESARFEWLHLQNPQAPSRVHMVMSGDQVVGVNAVIKKSIIINGQKYIAGRNIDPAVNPDFRGQRIYSRLLDDMLARFKEIDIYFNFPNKNAALGLPKRGWRPIEVNNLHFFSRSEKIISKQSILSLISKLRNKISFELEVDEIQKSDLFFEKNYQDEFPIYIVKDMNYIKWRYDNPDRKYQYFCVSKSGSPAGYIICRFENSRCLILDIIKAQNHIKSQYLAKSFFDYVWKNYKGAHVMAWSQTAPGLKKSTIQKPGAKPTLVYIRPGDERTFDIDIFDENNWYMPIGESESM